MSRKINRLSLATGLLTVFCVILTLQTIANVYLLVTSAELLFRHIDEAGVRSYLNLSVLHSALDGLSLLSFVLLTTEVQKTHCPFGRKQTALLVGVAIITAFKGVAALFLPYCRLPYNPLIESAEIINPELDIQSFSYALVFFALATIFEYGRVLQEDSDSIL